MSPQGLCAWDVRRLIALSREFPVIKVSLSDIRELDEPYWCGEVNQAMTCRAVAEHARLIQECDLSHPVILSSDGRVMDGMHRICRALLQGHAFIDAVRFSVDPAPDHVGRRPEDLPYED